MPRAPRARAHQYDVLIDFISKHPGMINGKISGSFTHHMREKLWEELAARCNANDYDPHKTALKWRKTWSDLKFDVKREIRRNQEHTDVPLEKLSPLYQKVAALIGAVSAEEVDNNDDKELIEIAKRCEDMPTEAADTSTSLDIMESSNVATEPLVVVPDVTTVMPTVTVLIPVTSSAFIHNFQQIPAVTTNSNVSPDRPNNDEPDEIQLNEMVEFLCSHPLMITEQFCSAFTTQMNEHLWEELMNILNSKNTGPQKTLPEWRKVWSDLKSAVKSKVIKLQQYKRRIGGGPPPEPLNPLYEKIANLIAEVPVEADSNVIETGRNPRIIKVESLEVCSPPTVFDAETIDDPPVAGESSTPPPPSSRPFIQTLEKAIPNVADGRTYRRRPHRHQEVDDKHVGELVAAEQRKAAAIEKLSDVVSAANVINERKIAVEEERNRILQEQSEIERTRNVIFQNIATHISTFFPSHMPQ